MRKAEITEIKKQMRYADCSFTRIAGWIVNEEKDCIHEINDMFLNFPEEQIFKWFDLFQKGLSGKRGKNLYNLKFEEDRGGRIFLRRVVESKLKTEPDYQILMENIIEQYETTERFAIFIVHGVYDIPGKASDGTEMEDASDEVYEYIMTLICPVTLSKPGLSYDGYDGIKEAARQWMIGGPEQAFVFPAFNERSSDYDHIWFYTRKPEEPSKGIVKEVLGCRLPDTPEKQREAFMDMINPSAFSKYGMNKIKELYREVQMLALEQEDSGEPIDKQKLKSMLKTLGVNEETAVTETEIILKNIVNLRHFEIQMEDAAISVDADRADLLEMREIDGEKYILVRANGIVMAGGIELGEDNGQGSK